MQTSALVHNFDKSLLVEADVIRLLETFWAGQGFADVTKDTAYHGRDVDYVFTPQFAPGRPPEAPQSVWVEMKADSTKYHNIFFELLSNGVYNVDTPGCFMFSQAYAWAYVFAESKEVFVFELKGVRTWVLANFIMLKPYLKTTTNKKPDGSFAPTMGFAIPVEKLLGWLSASVPMTYARLPGFGEPVNGAVPRSRLPARFRDLNRGLPGIIAMLNASPAQSTPTKVVQFQAQTSPLRRHVLGIKQLALSQTNGMYESIMKRALGPHYEALMQAA